MSRPLEGQVAAITGASSGIGASTARTLARAGAAVVLAARNRDRLEAVVADLERDGGQALAVPTDVGDERQAHGFINAARERFGRLEILVNAAGAIAFGPLIEAEPAATRAVVAANALGVVWCSQFALALMSENGGGQIVNISSVSGRQAAGGTSIYNLTKFGVSGFSEALRQEARHAGVRVSVVEPGFTETPMLSDPQVGHAASAVRAELGRLLDPDDVADAILWTLTRPPHVTVSEIVILPATQG